MKKQQLAKMLNNINLDCIPDTDKITEATLYIRSNKTGEYKKIKVYENKKY